jgi:hypothetical protein
MVKTSANVHSVLSDETAAKASPSKSNNEWHEPPSDWIPIGRAVFRFGIADPDDSAGDDEVSSFAELFSVEASERSKRSEGGASVKIANHEPRPASLEELTKVLQRNTQARKVEIDQEACCFRFVFDLAGGGVSAHSVPPWTLLAVPDTPLAIDPRIEAEALFNKEGLVLVRRSDEEIKHDARQNKAVRDATGLVWRRYMLPAFDRSISARRVALYARVQSPVAPLKRLSADVWPILRVLDWQCGIARDPEGAIYYSIHAASISRAAARKIIRAHETSLKELLVEKLRDDPKMSKAQAEALWKSGGYRVSWRTFQRQVWPDAREEAGLPRKAPAGRKRKSLR